MKKIPHEKTKKVFSAIAFTSILSLLFIYSGNIIESIKNTINIFIYYVFPSLFPFLLFTEFSLNTKILDSICTKFGNIIYKIFPISKNGLQAIIIGFLCGYPNGAKVVSKLYNNNLLSFTQAKYISTFINNCNPIFIYTTVGICMFNNVKIGILLLICHYLSSILIGIFSSRIYKYNNIIHENDIFLNTNNIKRGNNCKISVFSNLQISLKNTFKTLLNIFGFLLIFNLMSQILKKFLSQFLIKNNILCIITSIFEITSGISDIVSCQLSYNYIIILTSFLLGFSGICIIFQVYSISSCDKIPFKTIFCSKILHGLLSGLICYIFLKTNIFNFEVSSVYHSIDMFNVNSLISYEYMKNIVAFYLIFTILILTLLFINRKKIVKKF